MKKIVKTGIILAICFPLILFLHTGWVIGVNIETFQAVFFSAAFVLSLTVRKVRKYIFILSALLIAAMIVPILLNNLNWANILGATGAGLGIVVILTYLPDFIKKGYIAKL